MRRAGALLLLALCGCRFETRQPDGRAGDDVAVEAATATFYRALAAEDSAAIRTAAMGAATVLVVAGRSAPSLVGWRALLDIPERRTVPGGVRLIRTEIRVDGDLASVQAVIAGREGSDAGEFEASDLLTLARRDGEWRVAHALFGSWHPRTAP